MGSLNYKEKLPDENEKIEYKASFNKLSDDIWETISAFENTSGGILVLGIQEKDSSGNTINYPKGVKDSQKILEQFWSNIDQKMSFNTIRNDDIIQIHVENNRTIIQITIHQATDNKIPVTAEGIAYIRKGSIDKEARGEDYKNLVTNASNDLDTEVFLNYDVDDLDINSINEYKRILTERKQYKNYRDLDLHDFLKRIGVISKDRNRTGKFGITSGGLLFFGKNDAIIQKFPSFQLEYYDQTSLTDRWNNRISSVIDNLNIFSFYQAVSTALNRTVASQFELDDQNKMRKDTAESMIIALREALLNMLMHANYYEDGIVEAHAHFNYYEFINPGKMKVPVEDFFTTNDSKIRNTKISKLFVQMGGGERAGHGGEKIYESAIENNYRVPEIKSDDLKTKLKIWKVDYVSSFSGKEIDSRERAILKAIISKPNHSMSHKEIESETSLTRSVVSTTINDLISKNILEKVGQSRATRYVIKQTSDQLLAQMEVLPQLFRKQLKNQNK